MKYEEAEIQMASLMRDVVRLQSQLSPSTPFGDLGRIGLELHAAKMKLQSFGEILAANPEFFDVMEPWMVDIGGPDVPQDEAVTGFLSEPSKESLESAITSTGALAQSVMAWLRDNNYAITDSGAGPSGWHLGVPCNEALSRRLCAGVHIQFRDPIRVGLLYVYRRFWGGWRLPTLRNTDSLDRLN